jgi:hypothetical protein
VAGAPLVAWFSVNPDEFVLVRGEPKTFASSEKVSCSFCADCGTPLTYQHADLPDEIDVSTCSLDLPELVPPQDHTRTGRQLPWVHLDDGLPRHRTTRSESGS